METKLAFFVISTQLGGAERSLLDLLRELKKQDAPITVLTPLSQGPLLEELQKEGVNCESLDLPSWFLSLSRKKPLLLILKSLPALIFSLKLSQRMKKKIEENHYSHVHSTGLKFHLLLSLISSSLPRIQFVIHMRDILSQPLIKKFLEKKSANKNLHFISNSKVTAAALQPIPSKVIYNGFNEENKVPSDLKQQLGVENEAPLIGMVGAIARWKGQREFLDMARLILQQRNDVHFLIVGSEIYDTDGDKGELESLKQKVKLLNIGKNVHFLPFQKNLATVYSGLDVLVHSSIHPEPFGRVVVEAMMFGCPVTAAGVGGPSEIIHSGENGLLHAPGDPGSMAKNVQTLLDDEKFRQKISQKGRHRALDFSLERHTEAMKKELSL